MDAIKDKPCYTCKVPKPIDEFTVDGKVSPNCRECRPALSLIREVNDRTAHPKDRASLSTLTDYMHELEDLWGGRRAICEAIKKLTEKRGTSDGTRLKAYQMILNLATAANKLEPPAKDVEDMSDAELAEAYMEWAEQNARPRIHDGA